MSSAIRVTIGTTLLLALGACGGTSPAQIVRRDAARDLRCPEGQVQVEDLGGRYRASGCRRSQVYWCSEVERPGGERVACARENRPLPSR